MTQAPNEKTGGPRKEAARNNQNPPQSNAYNTRPQAEFPREVLEAMRGRLPEYLAARGVELRRQGARLVARCPRHEDSSPSFAVFAGGKACGCYPCGFSGDVFATSEWLGRAGSFPEAVADVAAALGVSLPQGHAQSPPRPAQAQPRPAPRPEPPFTLPEVGKEKIHAARLRLSDAFHAGEPIVDRIAESLGLSLETLRLASWGSCGLGLAAGSYGKPTWLCYCYPSGLKWRNPDPSTKLRFEWLAGRALAPWRWEWATKPEVRAVYVTEGESDCMALIEAGIESDGTAACVALPGKEIPSAWLPLFAGRKVILCLDRDPAGQAATAKVARLLAPFAAEILAWKGARPQ